MEVFDMARLEWSKKNIIIDHYKKIPFRLLKKEKQFGDPNADNILIQGDNLEGLKALLPYYAGEVKCIYIDPPYNTGREDWVYNDNVNSPEIREWLGKAVGKEFEDLSRHEKWICMIYPRLLLLWQFLKEDGVLFVSIDDNEVSKLKLLLDEIFGPQNFVETLIWNTEGHTDNQKVIKVNHEYILVYAKQKSKLKLQRIVDPNTREDSNLHRGYAENSITKNGAGNPPSIVTLPVGFPCSVEELTLAPTEVPPSFFEDVKELKYISRDITRKYGVSYPIRLDEMKVKNGELIEPCRVFTGWSSVNKLKLFINNDCLPIDDGEDKLHFFLSKNGVIYYRKEREAAQNILSVLKNMGTTETMRSELEKMGVNFQYPKPKQLISYLISLATDQGDIVLDSFGGSGTTGHSTLLLNKEDQKNRKFILMELDKEIAETKTAVRLEKVITGYESVTRNGNKVKIEGLGSGFQYWSLGESILTDDGVINDKIKFEDLARVVFYTATKTPLSQEIKNPPLIGVSKGIAVYLLYNGSFGNVENMLTLSKLRSLPEHKGPKIIYGEGCLINKEKLNREGIVFKQIPYEVGRD